MTIEAIKEEIGHLSGEDRRQLFDWLEELEEQAWDEQIAKDFAPGARGAKLLAEVDADIAAGRTIPLSDALSNARLPRESQR